MRLILSDQAARHEQSTLDDIDRISQSSTSTSYQYLMPVCVWRADDIAVKENHAMIVSARRICTLRHATSAKLVPLPRKKLCLFFVRATKVHSGQTTFPSTASKRILKNPTPIDYRRNLMRTTRWKFFVWSMTVVAVVVIIVVVKDICEAQYFTKWQMRYCVNLAFWSRLCVIYSIV